MKDFFTKCDQIRKKLWIWSHLLKKSFFENFIFCAVSVEQEVSDDLSVWSLTYHVTLQVRTHRGKLTFCQVWWP